MSVKGLSKEKATEFSPKLKSRKKPTLLEDIPLILRG